MAAKLSKPGIPKSPTTPVVTKLIGTCNPILLPNAFKKNNNIAPITSFTKIVPNNLNGLIEAPKKRSNYIAAIIIDTTTIGSIKRSPFIKITQ